jgi:ABC-type phosphate transport system substrate-binding protein
MTSGIVTTRAHVHGRFLGALACLLLVFGLVPARGAEVGLIKGAGATFPAPVYLAWAAAYEKAGGVRVSYDPVGSGRGLQQIRDRQVDFGTSDAPLTSGSSERRFGQHTVMDGLPVAFESAVASERRCGPRASLADRHGWCWQ